MTISKHGLLPAMILLGICAFLICVCLAALLGVNQLIFGHLIKLLIGSRILLLGGSAYLVLLVRRSREQIRQQAEGQFFGRARLRLCEHKITRLEYRSIL